MTLTIRRGTQEDALDLAHRLRTADWIEAMHLRGDVTAAVVESVAASTEVWAAEEDGEVICLWGLQVTPYEPITGVPWMVGSDKVPKHRKRLVRQGREQVRQWLSWCKSLCNVVHAENTVHVAWLKRLGFTFGDTFAIGPHQAPFLQFFMFHQEAA